MSQKIIPILATIRKEIPASTVFKLLGCQYSWKNRKTKTFSANLTEKQIEDIQQKGYLSDICLDEVAIPGLNVMLDANDGDPLVDLKRVEQNVYVRPTTEGWDGVKGAPFGGTAMQYGQGSGALWRHSTKSFVLTGVPGEFSDRSEPITFETGVVTSEFSIGDVEEIKFVYADTGLENQSSTGSSRTISYSDTAFSAFHSSKIVGGINNWSRVSVWLNSNLGTMFGNKNSRWINNGDDDVWYLFKDYVYRTSEQVSNTLRDLSQTAYGSTNINPRYIIPRTPASLGNLRKTITNRFIKSQLPPADESSNGKVRWSCVVDNPFTGSEALFLLCVDKDNDFNWWDEDVQDEWKIIQVNLENQILGQEKVIIPVGQTNFKFLAANEGIFSASSDEIKGPFIRYFDNRNLWVKNPNRLDGTRWEYYKDDDDPNDIKHKWTFTTGDASNDVSCSFTSSDHFWPWNNPDWTSRFSGFQDIMRATEYQVTSGDVSTFQNADGCDGQYFKDSEGIYNGPNNKVFEHSVVSARFHVAEGLAGLNKFGDTHGTYVANSDFTTWTKTGDAKQFFSLQDPNDGQLFELNVIDQPDPNMARKQWRFDYGTVGGLVNASAQAYSEIFSEHSAKAKDPSLCSFKLTFDESETNDVIDNTKGGFVGFGDQRWTYKWSFRDTNDNIVKASNGVEKVMDSTSWFSVSANDNITTSPKVEPWDANWTNTPLSATNCRFMTTSGTFVGYDNTDIPYSNTFDVAESPTRQELIDANRIIPEQSIFSDTYKADFDGSSVDVIICEGTLNPDCDEFLTVDGSRSRFVEYDWAQLWPDNEEMAKRLTAHHDYNWMRNLAPPRSTKSGNYNSHATTAGACLAGRTLGFAKGARIYNLNFMRKIERDGAGIPISNVFETIKRFHEAKPIQELRPGIFAKAPTIVNCSWGRFSYVNQHPTSTLGPFYGPFTSVKFRNRNIINPTYFKNTATRDMFRYGINFRPTYSTIFGIVTATYYTMPNYTPSLSNTIEAMCDAGVIMVSSAGNEPCKIAQPSDSDFNNYATCLVANFRLAQLTTKFFIHRGSLNSKSTITVGAMTFDVQRNQEDPAGFQETQTYFSARGSGVTTFAQGQDCVSPDLAEHGYGKETGGTSFSAPNVAGMIALLVDRYPTATPAQVKQFVARKMIAPQKLIDIPFPRVNTQTNDAGDPVYFGLSPHFSKRTTLEYSNNIAYIDPKNLHTSYYSQVTGMSGYDDGWDSADNSTRPIRDFPEDYVAGFTGQVDYKNRESLKAVQQRQFENTSFATRRAFKYYKIVLYRTPDKSIRAGCQSDMNNPIIDSDGNSHIGYSLYNYNHPAPLGGCFPYSMHWYDSEGNNIFGKTAFCSGEYCTAIPYKSGMTYFYSKPTLIPEDAGYVQRNGKILFADETAEAYKNGYGIVYQSGDYAIEYFADRRSHPYAQKFNSEDSFYGALGHLPTKWDSTSAYLHTTYRSANEKGLRVGFGYIFIGTEGTHQSGINAGKPKYTGGRNTVHNFTTVRNSGYQTAAGRALYSSRKYHDTPSAVTNGWKYYEDDLYIYQDTTKLTNVKYRMIVSNPFKFSRGIHEQWKVAKRSSMGWGWLPRVYRNSIYKANFGATSFGKFGQDGEYNKNFYRCNYSGGQETYNRAQHFDLHNNQLVKNSALLLIDGVLRKGKGKALNSSDNDMEETYQGVHLVGSQEHSKVTKVKLEGFSLGTTSVPTEINVTKTSSVGGNTDAFTNTIFYGTTEGEYIGRHLITEGTNSFRSYKFAKKTSSNTVSDGSDTASTASVGDWVLFVGTETYNVRDIESFDIIDTADSIDTPNPQGISNTRITGTYKPDATGNVWTKVGDTKTTITRQVNTGGENVTDWILEFTREDGTGGFMSTNTFANDSEAYKFPYNATWQESASPDFVTLRSFNFTNIRTNVTQNAELDFMNDIPLVEDYVAVNLDFGNGTSPASITGFTISTNSTSLTNRYPDGVNGTYRPQYTQRWGQIGDWQSSRNTPYSGNIVDWCHNYTKLIAKKDSMASDGLREQRHFKTIKITYDYDDSRWYILSQKSDGTDKEYLFRTNTYRHPMSPAPSGISESKFISWCQNRTLREDRSFKNGVYTNLKGQHYIDEITPTDTTNLTWEVHPSNPYTGATAGTITTDSEGDYRSEYYIEFDDAIEVGQIQLSLDADAKSEYCSDRSSLNVEAIDIFASDSGNYEDFNLFVGGASFLGKMNGNHAYIAPKFIGDGVPDVFAYHTINANAGGITTTRHPSSRPGGWSFFDTASGTPVKTQDADGRYVYQSHVLEGVNPTVIDLLDTDIKRKVPNVKPSQVSNPFPLPGGVIPNVVFNDDGSKGATKLTWNHASNYNGYKVFLGTKIDGTTGVPSATYMFTTSANEVSVFDGVTTGSSTQFRWRVDPFNEFGTTSGKQYSFTTLAAGASAASAQLGSFVQTLDSVSALNPVNKSENVNPNDYGHVQWIEPGSKNLSLTGLGKMNS